MSYAARQTAEESSEDKAQPGAGEDNNEGDVMVVQGDEGAMQVGAPPPHSRPPDLPPAATPPSDPPATLVCEEVLKYE